MDARRLILFVAAAVLVAASASAIETQLTTVDAVNTQPSWSWGRGYIAYETDREYEEPDIWYMSDPRRFDTWAARNATKAYGCPCWDDTQIYVFFHGEDGGHDRIYGHPAGNVTSPIAYSTPSAGNDRAPDFHGSSGFVLHSSRTGDDEIYWMSESGEVGGFTALTSNSFQDQYPCWSPDGSWVAFASDRGGDWDIWVMSAAGEADTVWQLTSHVADESGPAWSPSGEFIAFHRVGYGIVAADVASRTEHQVTSNATDAWPTWSGGGEFIAFARGSGVSHIWMTDNVPASVVESVSWGRLKALFR
jgi:Tol biopolymer transport system component